MYMPSSTISQIPNSGLCTGCATCAGICPTRAIAVRIDARRGSYVPAIDLQRCTSCGLCYEVCPSRGTYFAKSNSQEDRLFDDPFVGEYLKCYVGHSRDYRLRLNSSSGGMVTQLLIVALEKGLIDGALVTKMSESNPLRPKPFIAKTKEEILLAAQSKYCPVPVNIGLNEISKTPGRYAIVGLPCHIQGARKAARKNATLRDRLVLYLGLACNHQPTFRATEYLLKRIGVSENQVDKIEYRSKGWPGKMTITLKDGRKKLVDYSSPPYWGGAFSDFFYLARCTICEDKLSEYADLSFMDAWLPEFSEQRMCESIIISRTPAGEKLLQSAMSENVISVFEIPVEKVIASQPAIASKRARALYSARARLLQQSHRAIPISRKALLSASTTDYVKALSMPLRMYISEKPSLWFIVDLYLLLSRSRRSPSANTTR